MSRCIYFWAQVSCTFLLLILGSAQSHSADRVALVIGNGAYQNVATLANPTRDASDIAASLGRLGFAVATLTNATANETRKALIEFGRSALGAEMAVVFYAGHGIEVSGENWLIPIEAELVHDTDIENEAVSLRSIVLQVSKARQLGLVILDACRNNPFAAKMQRSIRARAVTRGLAPTEPTDNVLVAFAAKDGTIASDGHGLNSPFTAALLRNLETPALEITFLFRNVRDDVMETTGRAQQPFVYGSLSREAIYFKPPEPGSSIAPPVALAQDEVLWNAIKDSAEPAMHKEFLKRFPASSRAPEAKRSIEKMKTAALATTDGRALAQPNPFFTEKDAKAIADVASRYKMAIPLFEMTDVDPEIPPQLRRFIGVWASKSGYGGTGRQAMMIVTSVDLLGRAQGYYVFGPATKTSFYQTPSGYDSFSAKVSGHKLEIVTGTMRRYVTMGENGKVQVRDEHNDGKQATIYLEPLWMVPTK